jgi:hypothetical protein
METLSVVSPKINTKVDNYMTMVHSGDHGDDDTNSQKLGTVKVETKEKVRWGSAPPAALATAATPQTMNGQRWVVMAWA